MDVWSRSGSKYLPRAIALLIVNILLFSGVACFAYWLRAGEFFAPIQEGYWASQGQAFGGVGRPDISLAAFLIEPISIHDVPMQVPIVGLLMAALISIPILVAILYRFPSSIPFILIIGFIAVMPWLAITLLGSCIIASVRPFRTRIRFMSAMLALVPVIVYLVLAYAGTRDVVVGRIDPVDRIKFVAPWVLAIVASAVVFSVVLSIARIVNYRPGAVTPLLIVMFATPVLLFEKHVGRDELYYRLLERMDCEYFSDWNAGLGLRAANQDWRSLSQPPPVRGKLRSVEEKNWEFELSADLQFRQSLLAEHQMEVAARCGWFLHQFPYSPYAPNVLFIKARAGDLRLDAAEFRKNQWIRFYDDIPQPQSRQTWQIIAENRPGFPMAAYALLRMSQLDAQSCDVDRAIARTSEIIAIYDRSPTPPPEDGAANAKFFLNRPPLDSGLGVDLDQVVLKATRLHDLLVANAADETYRSDPLCGTQRGRTGTPFGLLDLDPREDGYADKLKQMLAAFPQCQLTDNIELELALHAADVPAQIAALRSVLERFPDGDAAPEAMIRLGLAYKSQNDPLQAAEILGRLVNEHPRSIWARQSLDCRLLSTPVAVRGTFP